jgi:threonine/homoserine/homoserine lactone efflux protein
VNALSLFGGDHIGPAFLLGAALGAAPGPVQLLILSETAKGGLGRGFRVMLGANSMLLLVMVVLAFGFSTFDLSQSAIDVLHVVGGFFVVWLAVSELRGLWAHTRGASPPAGSAAAGLGPTMSGIVLVLGNPAAWIFFATTASAVIAEATADGGRDAALAAAIAMTLGVSLTDLGSSLIGTGSRALLGERGLTWIRAGLAVLLLAIGVAFVFQGATG